MKQLICCFLTVLLLLGLSGCSENVGATVVDTFEQTPEELVEQTENVIWKTYYEMSDGTWKTDSSTYLYRLTLTGRLTNAAKDTTYTVLSNTENITFEQAWKASGLSSRLEDYFKAEDAVIVAVK